MVVPVARTRGNRLVHPWSSLPSPLSESSDQLVLGQRLPANVHRHHAIPRDHARDDDPTALYGYRQTSLPRSRIDLIRHQSSSVGQDNFHARGVGREKTGLSLDRRLHEGALENSQQEAHDAPSDVELPTVFGAVGSSVIWIRCAHTDSSLQTSGRNRPGTNGDDATAEHRRRYEQSTNDN
jgi:hypothetical protein